MALDKRFRNEFPLRTLARTRQSPSRPPFHHAESTGEERKLWAHLRAQRWGGFKFRRHHRIGPYFADFCCVAQHLIIELDERKDGLRTAYLNPQGYRVLRFWNEQVNTELQGVLQAIHAGLTDS
jgi:very-short-patch-repair endonuclease